MTQKASPGNTQAIFLSGLKILCDGYVIESALVKFNRLIIKKCLCDCYVIEIEIKYKISQVLTVNSYLTVI